MSFRRFDTECVEDFEIGDLVEFTFDQTTRYGRVVDVPSDDRVRVDCQGVHKVTWSTSTVSGRATYNLSVTSCRLVERPR